jgi:hypothetical protein
LAAAAAYAARFVGKSAHCRQRPSPKRGACCLTNFSAPAALARGLARVDLRQYIYD